MSLVDVFELNEFASEDCSTDTLITKTTGVLPHIHDLSPETQSVYFTEGNIGLIMQKWPNGQKIAMVGNNSQLCLEILGGAAKLEINIGDDPDWIDDDSEYDLDAEKPTFLSEEELEALLEERGYLMDDDESGGIFEGVGMDEEAYQGIVDTSSEENEDGSKGHEEL